MQIEIEVEVSPLEVLKTGDHDDKAIYNPTNLKILSWLKSDRAMIKVIKAGLATVIMITVGDYCSVTTGVLQMSTTTKNSRPKN